MWKAENERNTKATTTTIFVDKIYLVYKLIKKKSLAQLNITLKLFGMANRNIT